MTDPWLWIRLAAEGERMLKDKLLADLCQSMQEKLDAEWTDSPSGKTADD